MNYEIDNLESATESSENYSENSALEALNRQQKELQESIDKVSSQNESLQNQIQELNTQKAKDSECLKVSDEDLRTEKVQLEKELAQIEQEISKSDTELTELNEQVRNLSEKNDELEEQLEKSQEGFKILDSLRNKLKKDLETKDLYSQEMEEQISNHISREQTMATQLFEFRKNILTTLHYLEYDAVYISSVYNSACKFIIKKENEELKIEIHYKMYKSNYKLSEIEAIYLHRSKPNRFYFVVSSKKQFESQKADSIVRKIRQLQILTLS